MSGRIIPTRYKKKKLPRQARICAGCNDFFHTIFSSKQKYCSSTCRRADQKSTDAYVAYYNECKFKFHVYHFPEEFDLSLLEQHGWYKAKNNGDNLKGVSRDHKISVKHGWKNDIPSDVIRHPANCELMLHSDNSSKSDGCSIDLEEFLKEIKIWNAKHPKAASL